MFLLKYCCENIDPYCIYQIKDRNINPRVREDFLSPSGPTGAQDPHHDHFLEYLLHFIQEFFEETIYHRLKMLLSVHININDFVFETIL